MKQNWETTLGISALAARSDLIYPKNKTGFGLTLWLK
jgi:hypothetical protein